MLHWFEEGGELMVPIAALGLVACILGFAALGSSKVTLASVALLGSVLVGTFTCLAYAVAVAHVYTPTSYEGTAAGHALMIARGLEEASHVLVLGMAVVVPSALLALTALVRSLRSSHRGTAREP